MSTAGHLGRGVGELDCRGGYLARDTDGGICWRGWGLIIIFFMVRSKSMDLFFGGREGFFDGH